MKYLRVVYCEWVDSTTEVGWDSADSISKTLAVTYSIGIFIKETEDAVVIANSYDPSSDEINGRIYIPLASINKIRTLCQIQTKSK